MKRERIAPIPFDLPTIGNKIKVCNHVWIEVGKRRWCVQRYDEGGCGDFQTNYRGRWHSQRNRYEMKEPHPQVKQFQNWLKNR